MFKSAFHHGLRSAVRLAWLAGAALCGPPAAFAHDDGAYWHDSGPAGLNSQWMLTLPPTKTLAELSLPGTHDSGTYPGIGGPSARTQTMSIREQLVSGIRWLDIRLKHYDPVALRNCNDKYTSSNCQLLVFHTIANQKVEFERDVLQPVISFLNDNPSELVIMRIAKENDDVAQCDCNPARPLNALFRKPAVVNGVTSARNYGDWLIPYACPDPEQLVLGPVRPVSSEPDPASCNVRGRVLVIDQYLGGTLSLSFRYRGQFDDENGSPLSPYVTPGYGPLKVIGQFHDNLWLPVKEQLARANAQPAPPGFLYNAGLSGNGPSFPFFFASGHVTEATGAPRLATGLVDGLDADSSTWPDFPRTNCAFGLCTISYEGMNTLVANYLARPEFRRANSRVGIVNADFPGNRFIRAVAGVNAGVVFDRPTFGYTLKTASGRTYQPGTWANQTIVVTPVCLIACTSDRASITEDLPDGFSFSLSGGGHTVRIAAPPVRIDLARPTITAAAVTAPGAGGWYTRNVAVHFTCADSGGSGVATCPPDEVLTQERSATSSTQYAFDVAGNKSNPSNQVTVRIDKTPPRVSYLNNLGSYAPGQLVDIRCVAEDRESGIASSTCVNIQGPAASFGPGTHRFSATATDVAGLTGTAATSFTVAALPGDATADGSIDCRDFALVRAAFGQRAGAPGFDLRADINGDGIVDIKDLSFVAQKLPAGTACP